MFLVGPLSRQEYMRFKAKQFARAITSRNSLHSPQYTFPRSWGCLDFHQATNFEAHIYPYKGVDIVDIVNTTMDYEPLTLHEQSTVLPLKVFQAQPPQSTKYITLVLEPNEESVNVVISGNTWAFRDQLGAHGCPGARQDNESRTYYRYMTDRFVNSSGL